jgi:hypothetical protein
MLSKTARADDDRIVLGRWGSDQGAPLLTSVGGALSRSCRKTPLGLPQGGPPLAGQCRFGTRGHGRLRRPLRPPAHRWEKGAVRSAQGHAAPCGCLPGQQAQRLCSGPVPLGKAPAFWHCHGIGNVARGPRSVDGPPQDPSGAQYACQPAHDPGYHRVRSEAACGDQLLDPPEQGAVVGLVPPAGWVAARGPRPPSGPSATHSRQDPRFAACMRLCVQARTNETTAATTFSRKHACVRPCMHRGPYGCHLHALHRMHEVQ